MIFIVGIFFLLWLLGTYLVIETVAELLRHDAEFKDCILQGWKEVKRCFARQKLAVIAVPILWVFHYEGDVLPVVCLLNTLVSCYGISRAFTPVTNTVEFSHTYFRGIPEVPESIRRVSRRGSRR